MMIIPEADEIDLMINFPTLIDGRVENDQVSEFFLMDEALDRRVT